MRPLQDPKTQIRLLWLRPGGPGEKKSMTVETSIRLETSIFALDDAPEYCAISYTWGTWGSQEIFIDDEPRLVRLNCRHALRQARLHHGASWVWIDSLCVNQMDSNEKSHQVKRMGSIFASAHRVLCCIGVGTSDVETIESTWPEFLVEDIKSDRVDSRQWKKGTKASRFFYEPATAKEHVELIIRSDERHDYPPLDVWQFHEACDAFVNRDYWQRLWIVQEYRLAKARSILCGSKRISEVFLANLCQRKTCRMQYSALGADVPLHALVGGEKTSYKFADLAQLQCADIRDRIYGTAALFQWREDGHLLEPDYTRSRASLASALINQSKSIDEARDLCRMLDVDLHEDMVRETIQSNQTPRHKNASTEPAIRSCRLDAHFYMVHNDRNGKLKISQWAEQDSDHPHDSRKRCCLDEHKRDPQRERWEFSKKLKQHGFRRCRAKLQAANSVPQVVYRGKKSIGLVCHNARPGDLLMLSESPSSGTGSFCLVLRNGSAFEPYRIVGQGIAYRAVFEKHTSTHRAEIRASGNDLLMLFAQDLLVIRGADQMLDFEIDRQARLERLWTQIPGEVVLESMQTDGERGAVMCEDPEAGSSLQHAACKSPATPQPARFANKQCQPSLSCLVELKARLLNF